MLSIYLGCLAFGGILLGASALGGHHDNGHGGGGHSDGSGGEEGHGHLHTAFVPVLSMRFWTFTLAFFGLTGAVLTALAAVPAAITAGVAAGLGIGAGYGASRLLGALTQRPVGLLAATPVGREGKVLLPVEKNQRGKIRISVAGMSTDLIAETETDDKLLAGATVLVVGMRGNVAIIERSPTALPPIGEGTEGGPKESS